MPLRVTVLVLLWVTELCDVCWVTEITMQGSGDVGLDGVNLFRSSNEAMAFATGVRDTCARDACSRDNRFTTLVLVTCCHEHLSS